MDDYSDYLTVETEGGEFKISLIARRDAPQLNVPSTLDVGKYWWQIYFWFNSFSDQCYYLSEPLYIYIYIFIHIKFIN